MSAIIALVRDLIKWLFAWFIKSDFAVACSLNDLSKIYLIGSCDSDGILMIMRHLQGMRIKYGNHSDNLLIRNDSRKISDMNASFAQLDELGLIEMEYNSKNSTSYRVTRLGYKIYDKFK